MTPSRTVASAPSEATSSSTRGRIDALRPVFHIGSMTRVWRRRAVLVLLIACVLALLVTCLSVGTGSFTISVPDVLSAMFGGGDSEQRFIVRDLRMPRAVIGLVVGAALGLSGALVQAIARNPLASPDLLGVTSGAGTSAVFVLTGAGGLAAGVDSTVRLTGAAIIGGLGTGALVYLLAARGGMDAYRLLLTGVAVTSLMSALTEWMLLRVRIDALGAAQSWLFGSLGEADWSDAWPTLLCLVALSSVAIGLSRAFPVLHLSDDSGVGLGLRLGPLRAALLLVAVLLVGAATAACGPVPFVAFVAPHIASRLTGMATPPLTASALAGAVLLVLADWAARFALPFDLPVGVLTSMIGAPFMVYLVVQQSRKVSA